MKKYLRGILCLMLVLSMVACFAACGAAELEAGTYYFVSMTKDGETQTVEDLEKELEGTGVSVKDMLYLQVNDDGTAVLCFMGEKQELKWDAENMWPADKDGTNKSGYTYEDGEITLSSEGYSMTFEKG